jgi:hypothetical protein
MTAVMDAARDRGVAMATVPVRIVGRRLPGASWSGREGIHVGVQRGSEVVKLVTGDAADAIFDIDVELVETDEGAPDFRGPYVHGRRGERFIYLVWGEVDAEGVFTMFRRVKLPLSPLAAPPVHTRVKDCRQFEAYLELTDPRGRPLAATVRPPWVSWRIDGDLL